MSDGSKVVLIFAFWLVASTLNIAFAKIGQLKERIQKLENEIGGKE